MVKHSMEKSVSEDRNSSSSAKYRGVRRRNWGKWVSEIRLPNSRERIWLGSYDSAEKAARAFDAALFCLRGAGANFNFPDNPPNIPGCRGMSPSEIQEAAARFANSVDDDDPVQKEVSGRSESVSTSVSDITTASFSLPEPFYDAFFAAGTDNFGSDFGLFPGFDDLSSDFLPQPSPSFDFSEENCDGFFTQDSSLWNF